MITQSEKIKKILASLASNSCEVEDTIIITGREVTIIQESFIKADAKAARDILENLKTMSQDSASSTCYSTPVIKEVEI